MDTFPENRDIYFMACFIYIFIIIRNISEVKRNTNITTVPITTVIGIALAIPAIPILVPVVCLFALYRIFISTILRIKHGTDFGGLLSGSDAFHVVGDPSNAISISCFMIRCEKYTSEEFFGVAKGLIARCFNASKFNSIFLKSYGYSYMLKQQMDVDECVVKMKTVATDEKRLTKEDLFRLLSHHYNESLPKNGKIPWQVLIGTQRVKWKDDGHDYYPLMCKIHHTIADGITLIKLLVSVVADKKQVDNTEMLDPQKLNSENGGINKKQGSFLDFQILKTIKHAFVVFGTYCYIFYLLPSSMVVFFMYKGKDSNLLYSKSISNQKVLGSYSEENDEYFQKIKRIKKKFPEIAFSTILFAAFSASLDNYFKKKRSCSPPYITSTIPVVTGSSDLRQLVPGKLDVKDINITNSYSVLLMSLPINLEKNKNSRFSTDKPLIKRLKLVHEEAKILRRATDYLVNYLVIKVMFAVLPLPILEKIMKSVRCTTVISVLPGPPKIVYDNGLLVLSDLIPWIPHLHNIATSFGVITYDGRLQIGLSADETVISSQSDAQNIVDDVSKYLDALEKETVE
ncbi:hypothetical protein ILUMI_03894 [Ignelater luminosus]|uniref:O-acyltransferase WSD1 C-terminal domain-containing protein n=1 Tax=Ignelater luminosus TaxID=2038154 RepID=A0A8K0GHW2_IGNLU|nr:hypothetical protein ILUMI_03894 [Ignelater luminosus]